jgi:spore germination cell wall hydrolase CwlJ-like protein
MVAAESPSPSAQPHAPDGAMQTGRPDAPPRPDASALDEEQIELRRAASDPSGETDILTAETPEEEMADARPPSPRSEASPSDPSARTKRQQALLALLVATGAVIAAAAALLLALR